MGQSRIFPCAVCGARDSRDESHAQGCPTLRPLSPAELMRIARNVEQLWADGGERRAEREQEAARETPAKPRRRPGRPRRSAPGSAYAYLREASVAEYRRPSKNKIELIPPKEWPGADAPFRPSRGETVRAWLEAWRPKPKAKKAKGAAR